ncbi:aminotransferase class IV [Halosquirtibacter xylanolyticus]|uniref:aminotransferase class IV n=1 Tax=Halosquirtibacter xylanolyticus TaxID=3374599 RepID=UPI003748E3BF|nr:aminotransferase class IV [Prolixibacteraceae bacterium]
MCQFIETMSLSNGVVEYVESHQARLDRTMHHFYPAYRIDLLDVLSSVDLPKDGVYRLTVAYAEKVVSIQWVPYQIRDIERFVCVEAGEIMYDFKYRNRDDFQRISALLGANEEAVIVQNGMVTDTTYTNLVFYRDGVWWTPKQCLLKGTQRQRLLDDGVIHETDIPVASLSHYTHFRIINAMMGWESAPMYTIDLIRV